MPSPRCRKHWEPCSARYLVGWPATSFHLRTPLNSTPALEVAAERTQRSRTFRRPDGTRYSKLSIDRVNFRDAAGQWQPIDSHLIADAIGWHNAANDFAVHFARTASADELVRLAIGTKTVTFGVAGARSVTGIVRGATVTYPDIFDGADLSFVVTSDGIQKLLRLTRRPLAPPAYVVRLTVSGPNIDSDADGFRISDAWRMPKPWMQEAETPSRPAPNPSSKVGFDLQSLGSGTYLLSLTPDFSWLSDPARLYPVTIDPSFHRTSDIDGGSYPDTFTENDEATTNHSSFTDLRVGTYNNGTTKARSFMKFDVGFLANREIVSATLPIYEWWSQNCVASRVDLVKVNPIVSWNSALTWNTSPQPSLDTGNPIDSQTVAHGNGCAEDWVTFEGTLKDLVGTWANDASTNYGVALFAAETGTTSWKRFYASDICPFAEPTDCPPTYLSYKPILTVEWNTPPTAATSLSPSNGTIAENVTPELSANYQDPDAGDTGVVQFEVYDAPIGDAGSTLVASGSGTRVNPGQRSYWTVPAGALSWSHTYYWRARSYDDVDASVWNSNPGVSYLPNRTPTVPALISPLDAAANPDAAVPVATPVLNATSTDDDPLTYVFDLGSFSSGSCTGTVVASSGGLPDETTWMVPASASLNDGSSYCWRVGVTDPYGYSATSGWRKLTVSIPKRGGRDAWPMWSHPPVQVNEANGNLLVSAPGPSYPTAGGAIGAALTYNSRSTVDSGLGAGWTLNFGDAAANPPVKLVDHDALGATDPARYNAAELVWADGDSSFYTHVIKTGATSTAGSYLPPLDETATLRHNPNGSWTLDDGEAISTFVAVAGSTSDYKLERTEVTVSNPGVTPINYTFTNSPLRISQVSDDVRSVSFNWSCAGAILCITGQPDNVTWKYIGPTGTPTAAPLTVINDGTRDLFRYTYSNGRIETIKNANDLDPTHASPGYNGNHAITITYNAQSQVSRVDDGPVGSGAVTSTWTFAYTTLTPGARPSNPSSDSTPQDRGASGYTDLTPPNQQGAQSPKSMRTWYDSIGRTLETVDVFGNKQDFGYDELDQLIWSKDKAGKVTDYGYGSNGSSTAYPDPTALLSVTGPDPDGAGSLGRPVTAYRYDETATGTSSSAGPALTGLKGSYFLGVNLAGRATAQRTDAQVNFTWSGSPATGIGEDNFSVRFTGKLKVDTAGAYVLSTYADDGTRLSVDGIQAIENWTAGAVRTVSSLPITLAAGWHELSLEYFDTTGSSTIQLNWSCSACGVSGVVPGANLRPLWRNRTSEIDPASVVHFHHFTDPTLAKNDYDLVKLADGTNVITSYSYDSLGRMTQKVMPKGNASRTIDGQGNLTGSSDTTYATDWTYYGLSETTSIPAACGGGTSVAQGGQLKSIQHAGLTATTMVYDAAGRPIAMTKAVGSTCSTYTAEGRLSTDKAPGEPQNRTFTYDPAGAPLTVIDASGAVTSEYDEAGRLVHSVDSYGAESRFTYDKEGNGLTRTAAVGALGSNPNFLTSYGYDDGGKLQSLTDAANRTYTFSYDARDSLKTTQMPNGTFVWNDYNDAGWLTAVYNRHGTLPTPLPSSVPFDANPIVDYAYTHDVSGRKTQQTRTGGGLSTETESYTGYDPLGRLSNVTLPSGTTRVYTYDLDSNRTQIAETPQGGSQQVVATYTYNLAVTPGLDELTSVTIGNQPAINYNYDLDGQTTGRGVQAIYWDGRGRHSGGSFTGGATGVLSYGFDALGRRRVRTGAGSTARYLFSGGGEASLFLTSSTGVLQSQSVEGPAGDLAQYVGASITQATVRFNYYNGHGDLAATADVNGARTAAYTYDPFGQVNQSQPSNATVERYTARWDKQLDTLSTLVQMGARPYDAVLGRFLAVDPVVGGSLNNFEYAGQDSVNAYDLDGRSFARGEGGWENWTWHWILLKQYLDRQERQEIEECRHGAISKISRVVGFFPPGGATRHEAIAKGAKGIIGNVRRFIGFFGRGAGKAIARGAGAVTGALNVLGTIKHRLSKNSGGLGTSGIQDATVLRTMVSTGDPRFAGRTASAQAILDRIGCRRDPDSHYCLWLGCETLDGSSGWTRDDRGSFRHLVVLPRLGLESRALSPEELANDCHCRLVRTSFH